MNILKLKDNIISKKQIFQTVTPLYLFIAFIVTANIITVFGGFRFKITLEILFTFSSLIYYVFALINLVTFFVRCNYYKFIKTWPILVYLLVIILLTILNIIVRNSISESVNPVILISLFLDTIVVSVVFYFLVLRKIELLRKDAPNESLFPDFYSTYLVKPVSEYNEDNVSNLKNLFSSSFVATVLVTIFSFIFSISLSHERGAGIQTFVTNLTVLATVIVCGIYYISYNVKNKLIKSSIVLGHFIFELVITLVYLGVIYVASMVDFGQDKFGVCILFIPMFTYGYILFFIFIKKKIFNCYKYIEDYLKTTKVEDNNPL